MVLYLSLSVQGIQDLANTRKDWPVAILKKVFTELEAETPPDLLARLVNVLCSCFKHIFTRE